MSDGHNELRLRKIISIAFNTFLVTIALTFGNNSYKFFFTQQVLAQTSTNHQAEADKLWLKGIEQFDNIQFSAALQSWEQALSLYRKNKDRQSEGRILGNIGIAYSYLYNYNKAIESLQKSLLIAQEIKDRQGESLALGYLGFIHSYYLFGNYQKALEYYTRSLDIAKEIKYRQGELWNLENLGEFYFYYTYLTWKHAIIFDRKAIESYEQSLAIAKEINDYQSQVSALMNLYKSYLTLGDYKTAIKYKQEYIDLIKKLPTPLPANLLPPLRTSQALTKTTAFLKAEAERLTGEGLNSYQNLDFETTLESWQQSLHLYRKIKDSYGESKTLRYLGMSYIDLGNFPSAIDYFQKSLAIARKAKDRYNESWSLGFLGLVYIKLGESKKAIGFLNQSLVFNKEIKDDNTELFILDNLTNRELWLLSNLGKAYFLAGDYAKALEKYQQSLKIARDTQNSYMEATALGNIGNIHLQETNYSKAIDYLEKSSAIFLQRFQTEQNGYQERGEILTKLGDAYRKSGKLDEAVKALYYAIDTWEDVRRNLTDINKISVFETQADAYQILQQVFIEQQNYDSALETAEKGRARAFVDLLNTRLSTKINDSLTQDLGTQLPNLQEVAQQQNATLVEYSIIYDEFKIQGKQQTKESELYIWVIKPTGKGTFQKVDLKPLWQKDNTTLSELVTMSRQSIGVRGRGIIISQNSDTLKTKQRFRRLHELLIKPIAEFLPTKESEKVIFIPQGSLFLVSFPALQDEQGKYLIEKHTILTAPSIQVLDLTRKQKLASQELSKEEILVVGNPTMPKVELEPGKPPEQLNNLPGAEQEAKNVAAILKTQALTGKQASKTAILQKIAQARIIHFATHGLLDDNRGLGSALAKGFGGAIALAPSDKDNGLLTAEEILNLKLNANLVVLSACDTGRGRVTGDGVIGLSRSLISAGVPSVIVSLWAVDDNSTSFLMTEFYKNIQQKQDKATALRKAMLTTMQKYPLPKNWAAFTLIGESE
ncbi:CHAT domain-containing protein [Nostoc sp. FACHB-87]|uniref:CHAT domain-containing protein n=1 Tax=Nostocaceae TaxID=1162 RepID=UPI0016873457|nr:MULTISPECIES: CHAT domain-containing tetratricopeptide repeat protein [Nostocaceae]MBD2456610.1 CHAT domain-containing protein [Nostoc sp. FACHB-87]MBD2477958.1 CHAT domain-containing protein [Anabaena sp. FACHB-83]